MTTPNLSKKTRQFDYTKRQPYLWDIDDPTGEAQFQYHERLWEFRARAEEHPLKAGTLFNCDLNLKYQISDVTIKRRSLPEFSASRSTSSCRLVRPLQTGVNIASQVWVAEVLPYPLSSEHSKLSSVMTPPLGPLVVFKFLQPSLMVIPPKDHNREGDYVGCYKNPLEMARKEHEAYARLADLQGWLLPYFYGLHSVVTLSGEECTAVVLEYIEGPTMYQLSEYANDPSDRDHAKWREYCNWEKLAQNAVAGLYTIHANGIIQGDISQANLIYDSITEHCVFIDFGHSSFDDSDDPQDQWFDHDQDWARLVIAFGKVDLHRHRIMPWLKSRVP